MNLPNFKQNFGLLPLKHICSLLQKLSYCGNTDRTHNILPFALEIRIHNQEARSTELKDHTPGFLIYIHIIRSYFSDNPSSGLNADVTRGSGSFVVKRLTKGTIITETAIAVTPNTGASADAALNAAKTPSDNSGEESIEYPVRMTTVARPR